MATYTEDFGSYDAGEWDPTTGPWEHASASTTPTTHLSITEDPCVPGEKYLKVTKPVGSTPSMRLNNTDADETSLEGDSLLMWRFPTIQSGSPQMPYAIQRSWLDAGNDLYGSHIRLVQGNIERYSVAQWNNGSETTHVADAGTAPSLSPDTWYLTRSNFQNNGDGTYTFRARTWEWGTEEPAGWDVDETAGDFDWDDGNNPNEQDGGFGVFASMPTNFSDGDSIDIAFISWSDDPDSAAPEATTAIEDFHDATTTATDVDSFNHSQGNLTDGLAVLRAYARWAGTAPTPTYDGTPMLLAESRDVSDANNGIVYIWYLTLGSSPGAGTKEVSWSGSNFMLAALSTYNNIDQDEPLYDAATQEAEDENDDLGGHTDSHVYGDLVLDAVGHLRGGSGGSVDPSEDCPYVHRVDGISSSTSFVLNCQDVVSSNAATPMFWDHANITGDDNAWVGATFAAKVTRIEADIAIPLENNLTINALFDISVENLVSDDPSLFSRYRLFVEMGPSTRTLDIDV